MRISSSSIALRMTQEVQDSRRRLFEVQERVGSGLRINRPSDDPQATSEVMAHRTSLALNDQYKRNANIASSELNVSEQAIASLGDVLQRAQELATQGANGALGADERKQIATEVGQLLNHTVNIGNTRYAGRYLFAGNKTDTAPFVADVPGNPTTVTYTGDSGLTRRELGQGDRLATNIPGDRAFSSVYSTLIQLRDHLMSNDVAGVSADGTQVQQRLEESLTVRSDIGARAQRVEVVQQQLDDADGTLKTVISGLEESDLTQNIVDMQQRETALQAALGATGRALNMSLLQFLQ